MADRDTVPEEPSAAQCKPVSAYAEASSKAAVHSAAAHSAIFALLYVLCIASSSIHCLCTTA
ncbi:hypothetical protein D1872_303730 [compost metagenome]